MEGSKESGDGWHRFFFNKRVEEVDGKRTWHRQSKDRRQPAEFGIISGVDDEGNLLQRRTCLEKLYKSVWCNSSPRTPAPIRIYDQMLQVRPR